jgi:hypothetical protein
MRAAYHGRNACQSEWSYLKPGKRKRGRGKNQDSTILLEGKPPVT